MKLLFIFISLLISSQGRADGIDQKTRDLLIDKFSNVYLGLPDSDSSKLGVTLRLADLLAERARLASYEEMEKGCLDCTAGREDRVKALQYYKEALAKTAPEEKGRVLTQIGHLYQMTGQEKEAVLIYQNILASGKDSEQESEAHLALGEMAFKKRKYNEARVHYQAILQSSIPGNKGLAQYHLAWCDMNEGRIEIATQALVRMLKTPELLTRRTQSNILSVDKQFQEEVSRDLVTFMSQKGAGATEAQEIFALSPESVRLANVFALAAELERLGQRKNAAAVYTFLLGHDTRPAFRLEGEVRMAQLYMESHDYLTALGHHARALLQWPAVCAKELPGNCRELKTRLKNFVVDWHKGEKSSPSLELTEAYINFLKIFSDDADLTMQMALVAQFQKNWELADRGFLKAAELWAMNPNENDKQEASLLARIEIGELSQDKNRLLTAIDGYLKNSPKRTKALDVAYQRARMIYQAGSYDQAAEALKAVALSNEKGAAELKEKAADLSLDALGILKRDDAIEAWAGEYLVRFPQNSKELQALQSKARLNQGAALAASSPKAALNKLATINDKSLDDSERLQLYKNRVLLAERSQNFSDARHAVEDLFRTPHLSPEDTEFALSHKAYLAELVLDFGTALDASKQLKAKIDERGWLRLALFADLARQDARPYYYSYLREAKGSKEARAISLKLIRESKDPAKDLAQMRDLLKGDNETIGRLSLETFALSGKDELLKKTLLDPALQASSGGKILALFDFTGGFLKLREKLAASAMDATSDRKMAQSIKFRAKLLSEAESQLKQAVQSVNSLAQLLSLDLLAKESQRFYSDIMSLPMPTGLAPEEEQNYLQLLSQQAAPHQVRAADAKKKVDEFWGSGKVLADLKSLYSSETPEVRKVLEPSLKAVREISPDGEKLAFNELLTSHPTTAVVADVNRQLVEQAQAELRADPLNPLKVGKLLDLERQRGATPMVGYLETRLENLKEQGRTQ